MQVVTYGQPFTTYLTHTLKNTGTEQVTIARWTSMFPWTDLRGLLSSSDQLTIPAGQSAEVTQEYLLDIPRCCRFWEVDIQADADSPSDDFCSDEISLTFNFRDGAATTSTVIEDSIPPQYLDALYNSDTSAVANTEIPPTAVNCCFDWGGERSCVPFRDMWESVLASGKGLYMCFDDKGQQLGGVSPPAGRSSCDCVRVLPVADIFANTQGTQNNNTSSAFDCSNRSTKMACVLASMVAMVVGLLM